MYKTTTMKHTFLVSILFCISAAFGQITLEQTDYLQAGDTARLSQTTDDVIDFQTTGPNSVWDFSYLQAETQSLLDPFLVSSASLLVQIRFGSFAPTRYVSDYYNSYTGLPFDQFGNFLPVNIEDIYRFTKINNDSISFPGYSLLVDGNDVPFQSDTIEVALRFPLNYGDSYDGRAYSKVDFNPIFNGIFIQYRQLATEVDGYGSVLTPYGSFNAIRVKHTIEEQDSLYADLFGFATWIPLNLPTQRIYEWWAKDESVPVMKIETQEINGDEIVTLIEYKDNYLGLTAQLPNEEMTLSVYPNPSSDVLHIETNSAIRQVELYSTTGKLVHHSAGNLSSSKDIDVSIFQEGTYILGVTTTTGKSYKQVIIKH